MQFRNYYRRMDHWSWNKVFRPNIRRIFLGKCEACCGDGGGSLVVHHIKYGWAVLYGEESINDLSLLCDPCHKAAHEFIDTYGFDEYLTIARKHRLEWYYENVAGAYHGPAQIGSGESDYKRWVWHHDNNIREQVIEMEIAYKRLENNAFVR